MSCLMGKHVAVTHVPFWTVHTWIPVLSTMNFYIKLQFLWEDEAPTAQFTNIPFPAVL